MATDVKVLRKLATQVQSSGSFEDGSMYLMPLISGRLMQSFESIENESIYGEGFQQTPNQGTRSVGETLTYLVDTVSFAELLKGCFGNEAGGVYTLGNNTAKMSIAALDQVNCCQYANCYIRRFRIFGSPNSNIQIEVEYVNETAEVRAVTGSFPSPTGFGEIFTFHELGGSGYVRVGDHGDALSSGDDVDIEEFSIEVINGFNNQFAQEKGTLTPLWGMERPSVNLTFRLSRFDSDTFLDFRDNDTSLQMSLYLYKSASATVLIEIPNFKIQAQPTDDETTKLECNAMVGRNGIGTSYVNPNMSFASPVRITLV